MLVIECESLSLSLTLYNQMAPYIPTSNTAQKDMFLSILFYTIYDGSIHVWTYYPIDLYYRVEAHARNASNPASPTLPALPSPIGHGRLSERYLACDRPLHQPSPRTSGQAFIFIRVLYPVPVGHLDSPAANGVGIKHRSHRRYKSRAHDTIIFHGHGPRRVTARSGGGRVARHGARGGVGADARRGVGAAGRLLLAAPVGVHGAGVPARGGGGRGGGGAGAGGAPRPRLRALLRGPREHGRAGGARGLVQGAAPGDGPRGAVVQLRAAGEQQGLRQVPGHRAGGERPGGMRCQVVVRGRPGEGLDARRVPGVPGETRAWRRPAAPRGDHGEAVKSPRIGLWPRVRLHLFSIHMDMD
jgi:hypothetical protein